MRVIITLGALALMACEARPASRLEGNPLPVAQTGGHFRFSASDADVTLAEGTREGDQLWLDISIVRPIAHVYGIAIRAHLDGAQFVSVEPVGEWGIKRAEASVDGWVMVLSNVGQQPTREVSATLATLRLKVEPGKTGGVSFLGTQSAFLDDKVERIEVRWGDAAWHW